MILVPWHQDIPMASLLPCYSFVSVRVVKPSLDEPLNHPQITHPWITHPWINHADAEQATGVVCSSLLSGGVTGHYLPLIAFPPSPHGPWGQRCHPWEMDTKGNGWKRKQSGTKRMRRLCKSIFSLRRKDVRAGKGNDSMGREPNQSLHGSRGVQDAPFGGGWDGFPYHQHCWGTAAPSRHPSGPLWNFGSCKQRLPASTNFAVLSSLLTPRAGWEAAEE